MGKLSYNDINYKVELTRLNVTEDIFDKILELWGYEVDKDIYSKFFGYKNYMNIYTNLDEYLICPTFRYNYVCELLGHKDAILEKKCNIQLILRKDITISKPISVLCGRKCYNMIIKVLSKYYSDDEIHSIFKEHSAKYNRDLIQFHYIIPIIDSEHTYKYNNVVKYDINKAHASAFIKMFPLAKSSLIELVNKGNYYKKKGDLEKTLYYKNLFNYSVGYLCKVGYRETYNYIVQNTTRLLFDTMDKCDGKLIYANTDSFAIQYPNNTIANSNELGEFKLECDNDIYFYRNGRYYIYEYLDTNGKVNKVGSCLKEVRDRISLRDGIVVDYDLDRKDVYYDNFGKQHSKLKAINIREVKVDEVII